jgi:hypothetical protein
MSGPTRGSPSDAEQRSRKPKRSGDAHAGHGPFRWEALDGLTVAAGFNGNGFSWAAITGQLVADLVTGQTGSFDLTPFDPNRFFRAGTVWANPFTAGETSTQPVA